MKKLLLLSVLAFGLFSCSNSGDTSGNSDEEFGRFTFTYLGETKTFIGQVNPNDPATTDIYKTNLYCLISTSNTATIKSINLDSGFANGAHAIGASLLSNTQSQSLPLPLVSYSVNGVMKTSGGNLPNTPVNVTITEETATYVSGTFSCTNLTGSFTKIPKKV